MSSGVVLGCVADAAAALEHAQLQLRAAEVASCVAIAALCDVHRVDESVLVAGCERWVAGGGDGTPMIGEFIAAEVAALLGVSVGAAFDRIAGVLNVRHRHPRLWAGMLAGELRAWEATRVADACVAAGLDAAACDRVDRWCATALALQPWQRVRTQVDKWILAADPAAARARAERAGQRRYVTVGPIEDGHVGVWGQVDAADGVALDQALDVVAAGLEPSADEHASGRDVSRSRALGVIARSVLGQDELPAADRCGPLRPAPERVAEIVVRVDGADLADPPGGVASVDQWGSVLLPQLAELLAGCRVTVRPVLGAGDVPGVASYETPAGMRRVLVARNPVDVFPFGARAGSGCEVDHTVPFDHAAPPSVKQTWLGNLGPLSRFAHRCKTHGGWRLDQPEPGVYHWISPVGCEYLVTAAGTLRIGRPRGPARCCTPRDPLVPEAPPVLIRRDAGPPQVMGRHPRRE